MAPVPYADQAIVDLIKISGYLLSACWITSRATMWPTTKCPLTASNIVLTGLWSHLTGAIRV
jgi:hypothetical protein